MIKVSDIINKTLPYIKENGRLLDYYLILNLISKKRYEKEILIELTKFQNKDGGFGHGLEPDNQMKESSSLATNVAIDVLESIEDNAKESVIKDIVRFYENTFIESKMRWDFITEDVKKYPHAVWWNYDDLDSFGYLNPNAEITGFIIQNKQYINKLDIDNLYNHVRDIITKDYSDEKSEHTLYSVIKFYDRSKIKDKDIEFIIYNKMNKIININKDEWDKYVPQPINIIKDKFHTLYKEYEKSVLENLNYLTKQYNKDFIWFPKWQWYQYDEVFEKLRNINGLVILHTSI